MKYTTTYKLENFIIDTTWEVLPADVQTRIKGCFIDLLGALIIGSQSEQFSVGLRLAEKLYGRGEIPVIGSDKKFGFMGAACAMGHSSNAYDIDDGHNIIRAHPGTSFVGGVLAAAYERNVSRNEFLTAMLVAYETTIRSGAAIMDYYDFAHSSGTFGAVGTAAGVGRLYGFSREQLNNVLSVADFNAPLVPGIRSVEYPSMNKDGVPFGVMVGCLAIMETLCGFEGNKNLLEADTYEHYLDDLGSKYHVMDLYFKPYTCCRWAHPAIDACISLLDQHHITHQDIDQVIIHTFHRATLLSKCIPTTADEAQYNIAYPVAAALVHKDFGFSQVTNLEDPAVIQTMDKLAFVTDPEIDEKFPAQRICRAEIRTRDGRQLLSKDWEPQGEAKDNIGIDWLSDKFRRITAPLLTQEGINQILEMVTGNADIPIRSIVDTINAPKYWKKR